VASRSEAAIGQSHDDITSDDHDTEAQLRTKYAPPAYDPDLLLSSSLGHLQLECVPEDLTEVEEEEAEVESVADEVNDGAAVNESSTAASAAAAAVIASSDDGLKQSTVDKSMSASQHHTDATDASLHVDSKPFLYFIERSVISQLPSVL